MATTTEVEGRGGSDEHGIRTDGSVFLASDHVLLYMHALVRGDGRLAEGGPLVVDTGRHTGRSPKAKFVVREPGSEERIWWGDVNQEISEERFEGLREKVVAHLEHARTSTSSTPSPGPIPRTGSRVRVDHATARGTRCSRRRSSSIRPRRSSRSSSRTALVLHAPAVEADPAEDGTRSGDVRRPAPTRGRGADRRHAVRRRDQEVDLHADERPAPARGRLPDALLGERRRRRPRRGLLRALGHRQDDAVGRPGAPPDRRRRARLGRRRRLQHRGRLLRQGDPPLRRGRAADLRDDAHLRHRARERRRGRARRRSTSTTTRRPRTRARPTSSSRSTNALPVEARRPSRARSSS